MGERPLLLHLPRLLTKLPFASLGEFPSRVEPLSNLIEDLAVSDAFIKRDDESAVEYGGNKVRTLEVLFGDALRRGTKRIYATGAFGSNHAAATVIHAPRVGLDSGALLFPQPPSMTARENLEVVASLAHDFVPLSHWAAVPFAMWRTRRSPSTSVMAPGGAVPLGALGYVSAALELAEQVRAGELPSPRRIVLGVGSTCTSAGLLVGVRVARALGLAFEDRLPQVVSVRVSPWPVTSPLRIVRLARRTAQLLCSLAEDGRFDFSFAELHAGLTLDRRFIGHGYGRVTTSGLNAVRRFGAFGTRALDTTYSAKSAAAMLHWVEATPGPSVYWATKSSVPLPGISRAAIARLPGSVRRWLDACD